MSASASAVSNRARARPGRRRRRRLRSFIPRAASERARSAGAIVNDAKTPTDVLEAAAAIFLPSDAPADAAARLAVGAARRRTCSMALRRLAKLLVGVEREDARRACAATPAFGRLVEGALCDEDVEDGEREENGEWLGETARAIGSLAPFEMTVRAREDFRRAAAKTPLAARHASAVSWALERCGLEVPSEVETALRGIPFRFAPNLTRGLVDLETLRGEVAFRREKLTTRDGRRVDERRETCWMGEPHVGSYAYSGKIMEPVPMVPCVERVRDALEATTGERFDCCLINLYPSETAACAWHTDPLMGTHYATDSIIVSIGETRRFSFRPLGSTDAEAHWVRAMDGDCIWMFANCQDEFEHCVMTAEGESNSEPRASIVFKRSLKRRSAPAKKKESIGGNRPSGRGGTGGGRSGGRGGRGNGRSGRSGRSGGRSERRK